MTIKKRIKSGKVHPGIEFGSARIKAVLIDDSFASVADGVTGFGRFMERYKAGLAAQQAASEV